MPADPSREGRPVFDVAGFLNFARGLEDTEDATVCAVLGQPVEHSLSPVIHLGAAVDLPSFHYVRVLAGSAEDLYQLTTDAPSCVAGYSVTMPGKPAALTVADEVSERAAAIGSANTLVALRDPYGHPTGQWRADNTDVVGLSTCLDAVLGESPAIAETDRCVVVGNGGTARPAVAALAAAGFRHLDIVARSDRALDLSPLAATCGMELRWTPLNSADLGAVCAASRVLVSTVPEPAAGPYAEEFARSRAIVDVIYDPYPTRLLRKCRETATPCADGLLMLAGQGAEQFRQFTGYEADADHMYARLRAHLGLV